ncbi:MAG: imidazole glycerol phosphate synthase subunit HisH [Candidatus Micrarchaeia archaeon]
MNSKEPATSRKGKGAPGAQGNAKNGRGSGCVGILDLGIGNVASVSNALERLGARPKIISRKGQIEKCSRLVMPGVGTFGAGMAAMGKHGDEIRKFAESGKPVLGICLGMQLMLDKGFENGGRRGLGMFKGSARRMDFAPKLPHVGWAKVTGRLSGLLEGTRDGEYYYFVHSYACFPQDKSIIAGECAYGKKFAACIGKGNVWGVQFHPEKSGRAGRKVLENFLKM